MKRTRNLSALLAAVCMIAAMLAQPVSAADATRGVAIQVFESQHEPISGDGINYEMWSCLYRDSASQFRGANWVCNKTYENLPDGQMWNTCVLYNATTGRAYQSSRPIYNVGGIYFNCGDAQEYTIGDEGVYCGGEIGVRNGTGYNVKPAPKTAAVYRDDPLYPYSARYSQEEQLFDALRESLGETGGYPVTASGKTYGSALLADEVGQQPDLILAEGCDGVEGYVLAEDLRPDAVEPDEVRAYMEEMKRRAGETDTIPLYDLEGNVIGEFPVQIPDFTEEVPPEIQMTIDHLDVERNWPRNSKGETYGIFHEAAEAGIDLDLIGAVGTNGEDGYYRESDMPWPTDSKYKVPTAEEMRRYREYIDTLPDLIFIPLYDVEGNVIGEFPCCIRAGWSPSAEEISRQTGKR